MEPLIQNMETISNETQTIYGYLYLGNHYILCEWEPNISDFEDKLNYSESKWQDIQWVSEPETITEKNPLLNECYGVQFVWICPAYFFTRWIHE